MFYIPLHLHPAFYLVLFYMELQVRSLGWEHPQRRRWQSTPGFLLGKSHGQRSLANCSPEGHKSVGQVLATKPPSQWEKKIKSTVFPIYTMLLSLSHVCAGFFFLLPTCLFILYSFSSLTIYHRIISC